MKFARFIAPGTSPEGSFGMLSEDGCSLHVVQGYTLPDVIETGQTFDINEVTKWLPPVYPPNILALGKNYPEHAKEFGNQEIPEVPIVFIKSTNTLTSHEEPIILPRNYANEVDYEAELAVVIGKTAKNISREDALEYVFGYTCAHDVSARDCQLRIDKQWARGKSFDTFCPLGPFLVTDIDPGDLRVTLRLNGDVMQDQSTSEMMFDIPSIIAHLSDGITLAPGTVILTGTPCGVGHARNPQIHLRPGDITEVEIEQIGILRNRVVAEQEK